MKVLGFTGLPNAGDELLVMESEKSAKVLSEERLADMRTEKLEHAAARYARKSARSGRWEEGLCASS